MMEYSRICFSWHSLGNSVHAEPFGNCGRLINKFTCVPMQDPPSCQLASFTWVMDMSIYRALYVYDIFLCYFCTVSLQMCGPWKMPWPVGLPRWIGRLTIQVAELLQLANQQMSISTFLIVLFPVGILAILSACVMGNSPQGTSL
ncbi:hypothetical protein BS78_05G039400 [Paspalum vaginatum]|nr:hypothetical protein BS78_05G039400 [Paspalum vaginatum]